MLVGSAKPLELNNCQPETGDASSMSDDLKSRIRELVSIVQEYPDNLQPLNAGAAGRSGISAA
jgi:hypothetical protein